MREACLEMRGRWSEINLAPKFSTHLFNLRLSCKQPSFYASNLSKMPQASLCSRTDNGSRSQGTRLSESQCSPLSYISCSVISQSQFIRTVRTSLTHLLALSNLYHLQKETRDIHTPWTWLGGTFPWFLSNHLLIQIAQPYWSGHLFCQPTLYLTYKSTVDYVISRTLVHAIFAMLIFLMHRLPTTRRPYLLLSLRMCSHCYDPWAQEVLPFLDLNLIGLSLPVPFPVDPVQHHLHSRLVHLPGMKIRVRHLSTMRYTEMRKQRSVMSLWPATIMIQSNERFLNRLLILLILDDLALAQSHGRFLSTLVT